MMGAGLYFNCNYNIKLTLQLLSSCRLTHSLVPQTSGTGVYISFNFFCTDPPLSSLLSGLRAGNMKAVLDVFLM